MGKLLPETQPLVLGGFSIKRDLQQPGFPQIDKRRGFLPLNRDAGWTFIRLFDP